MANLTLQQELAEIRTRVRKLQTKVLKKVKKPQYYFQLEIFNSEIGAADRALSDSEVSLMRYLRENKVKS